MSESDPRPPQPERSAWEGPEAPPPRASDEARPAGKGENWERDMIARLAFASLTEQRRARRWSIFFKILVFLYLIKVFWMYQGKQWEQTIAEGEYTALVDIDGVIADNAEASADNIVTSLRNAFESKGSRAVILRIISPGGSPVQAGYINDEIHLLRQKYPNVPVYAVVTDICASGGYYFALAADKIYADKASIVGSIGVRMSGLSTFGFTEAMKKLGIERRLLAAGEDKAMLDPFSPLKEDEVTHTRQLLETIHQQFINVVKQGRGNRLKGDDKMLFNGLYWTGEQSVALGLVDGLGSSSQVARDIVGVETIADSTRHPPPWERFAERLGAAMAKTIATLAENPANSAWRRGCDDTFVFLLVVC